MLFQMKEGTLENILLIIIISIGILIVLSANLTATFPRKDTIALPRECVFTEYKFGAPFSVSNDKIENCLSTLRTR